MIICMQFRQNLRCRVLWLGRSVMECPTCDVIRSALQLELTKWIVKCQKSKVNVRKTHSSSRDDPPWSWYSAEKSSSVRLVSVLTRCSIGDHCSFKTKDKWPLIPKYRVRQVFENKWWYGTKVSILYDDINPRPTGGGAISSPPPFRFLVISSKPMQVSPPNLQQPLSQHFYTLC